MLTSLKGRASARLFFIFHLALCLLAVSSCSRSNTKGNDLVKYGLNSPARSYRVMQSLCQNPCPDSNFEVYFNENSRVDSLLYLFVDGSPRVKEIYEYGKDGRLMRILTFDKDGRDSGIYRYEYDGNFISSCILFGINNDEISRWDHSNDGSEIVRTKYYEEGVLQTDTHSVYDGNLRHDRVYDSQGSLILSSTFEYYDLREKLPYSIQSDDLYITLDYNSLALPVRCNGAFLNATAGFYLDNSSDANPSVRYEYELDERGNWISRQAFRPGESVPSETLTREIVY